MWIARMENGQTFTQKDYDFAFLDHSKINSLQLLHNGRFFTITRGNKSQVLLQQRISTSDLHYTTGKVTKKYIGQTIFCVKDNIGRCVGWGIDHEKRAVLYLDFVGLEPTKAFYDFNFKIDEVIDNNQTRVFVTELDVRKKKPDEWTCSSCAVINTQEDKLCHYCKAPRRSGEGKK